MGCGDSRTKEAAETDKQLKEDAKTFFNTFKLLLLGAGESGKSTFVKQIRIIHVNGFTDEERDHYKAVINETILYSLSAVVKTAQAHKLKFSDQAAAERVLAMDQSSQDAWGADVIKDVRALAKDPVVQKVLGKYYTEFHALDSAKYFLDNIQRVTEEGFTPETSDILSARIKTTGIQEIKFTLNNSNFVIMDVGGQRSERKKWIHCFENVTAVLFFVALSEYDLTLYEDDQTNRMHESMKIFDEICNSRWFAQVPIIIFFNKKDLFAEKLKTVSLTVAFPDYTGSSEPEEARKYIRDQFLELNENEAKAITCHFTCATDRNDTSKVFDSVAELLVMQSLKDQGLLT